MAAKIHNLTAGIVSLPAPFGISLQAGASYIEDTYTTDRLLVIPEIRKLSDLHIISITDVKHDQARANVDTEFRTLPIMEFDTQDILLNTSVPGGPLAYARDTHAHFLRQGGLWVKLENGIIDIKHMVTAGDGLVMVGKKMSVRVASTSESFMGVGPGGLHVIARELSNHKHEHGHCNDPGVHDVATEKQNGFMSASDKLKLEIIAKAENVLLAEEPPQELGDNEDVGKSTRAAREDHVHRIPTDTPVPISDKNVIGVSKAFSKADHKHAHGIHHAQNCHVTATIDKHGFMSSDDKQKLSGIEEGANILCLTDKAPSKLSVDSNKCGSSPDAAHADHEHSILVGPPIVLHFGLDQIDGISKQLSRADHGHPLGIPDPPSNTHVRDGFIGKSDVPARSDHGHKATTGAPLCRLIAGGENEEGVSFNLARADHYHATVVGTDEDVTTIDGSPCRMGLSEAFARADHSHAVANPFQPPNGVWSIFGNISVRAGDGPIGSEQFGLKARSNGVYATTLGFGTVANIMSTAIGAEAIASGDKSLAAGRKALASQTRTIACGDEAKAQGIGCIAIGPDSEAGSGSDCMSIALGYGAKALYTRSIAIGQGVRTEAANQCRIGFTTQSGQFTGIEINDVGAAFYVDNVITHKF